MADNPVPVPVVCVVGARPNFIKMAALLEAFQKRPRFQAILVHTGQHYSPEMSASFFRDLELPEPDINLEVGGGSHTYQTAEIMKRIEPVLLERRPRLVLVVGDVNSTVASALVAAKLGIEVAHVEAGLRSFDRSMPEEINRIVTDVLSQYLFVTEPSGLLNLRAEGIAEARIHFTGNVMIDTLLRFREVAAQSSVLNDLALQPREYGVVTLHRPSNVDHPERLRSLVSLLVRLSKSLPLVFPVHPRTRTRLEDLGISFDGLRLTQPLGYLDFLHLNANARLMLTDSGGVQEETTILQVPCLTLRENTERPVTIEQGTNRLVGLDTAVIETAFREALSTADHPGQRVPELWDGHAAQRILDILEEKLV